MATTIRRLVPRSDTVDIATLEIVAREELQALEDEDLSVSFGAWEDTDDGVQFVCKVETPPGDPLGSQPPWRWWSSLFRTAEELRAELSALVARRTAHRDSPPAGAVADRPSAAAS